MIVYYFDEVGRYSGYGESATLPAGATDKEPATETDIFDGEMWVSDGSAIPQKLSRAQARGALIFAGLIDQVQPSIDAISDPIQRALAQNDWDNRLEFERDHPQLLAMAAALSLTDEDLDQLFIEGAKL